MPYVWSGGRQTAARFLIDNMTDVDAESLAALAEASVIHPLEMNERINAQLDGLLNMLPDDASPFLIYPGNGASQLAGALGAVADIESINVAAKRQWEPGQSPICDVEPFTIPEYVTHCLVIDDVISSGGTMCAVRQFMPLKVECWAASQMSQRFGTSRKKRLASFHRIVTGVELAGYNVSYVPINSVSTLYQKQDLARIYAERNVSTENRHRFLELLN